MDKTDRENLLLAVVFAALAVLCGGLLSSYFLWELVDMENHLQARLTFVASVIMYIVGAFSLDAFAAVLRLGVVRERNAAAGMICLIVHGLLRSALVFCNVGLLFISVLFIIDAGAELSECLGTLLFLAAIVCGYGFLYRLERRLKAQRAKRDV